MPVTFKSAHGTFLCAEDGGGTQGVYTEDGSRPTGLAVADRTWEREWEQFEILRIDEDHVALATLSGRIGCCEDYGQAGVFVFNREAIGPWETLRVVRMADTGVAFNLEGTDKFLMAWPDGHVEVRRPYDDVPGHDASPGPWETFTPSSMSWLTPPISGDRIVRPVLGHVRTANRQWADDSGLRSFRVCSWFPALRMFRDHREAALRQLDDIAIHWQGVRIFWHLGSDWWPNEYRVDPRWGDFDTLFREFLIACRDRGVRVSLSTGDMQVLCPDGNEDHWHEHMAALAASVDPQVIGWWGIWNEGWQNSARGSDVEYAKTLSRKVQQLYPWNAHALTDTNEEHQNLNIWGQPPANNVMIHGLRDWPASVRRPYNTKYEGNGWLVNEDEPTGDGPHVFMPTSDPRRLFAIYTMHVLAGFMTTFFGGHALKSWTPTRGLDRDWGFRELPMLWAQMRIPEDIQNFEAAPGHRGYAAIYPESFQAESGDGPHRCDNVQTANAAWAVVYGGAGTWRMRCRWSADIRVWSSEGLLMEKFVVSGERFLQMPASQQAIVIEAHRR